LKSKPDVACLPWLVWVSRMPGADEPLNVPPGPRSTFAQAALGVNVGLRAGE